MLGALLFSSCVKEDESVYGPRIDFNEPERTYSELEKEIMNYINYYRASENLPLINLSNFVSNIAETHTDYMIRAGVVSHDNFSTRVEILRQDFGAQHAGEANVYGKFYDAPLSIVSMIINSDSHHQVISRVNYNYIGISAKQDIHGNYYITHLFVQK